MRMQLIDCRLTRYKENVMKLSSLMREQIELDRPLERAVHAIEHVVRHHRSGP